MTKKEMRPTAKILVAAHKPYRMPEDSMYIPIKVGAALEKTDYTDQSSKLPGRIEYLRDNVGENISVRNPHYCELTGLYWAWKHIHTDYIGLVHYRRHFKGSGEKKSGIVNDIFDYVLTYRELEPMLNRYKVFVPEKRNYYIETIYSHYAHTHYAEHLDKTKEIISEKYPEYLHAYDKVMSGTSAHMFNMMIMTKELLNDYCEWLFDILMTLEDRVDVRDYSSFQGRYSGRVGELILNVWLEYQLESGKLKKEEIRILPYLYVEKINWISKGMNFLRAKFFNKKYEAQ